MYAGNKQVRERVDASLDLEGVKHPYIEELRDMLESDPRSQHGVGMMIGQWMGKKRPDNAHEWIEEMVSSTISLVIQETKIRDMQRKMMQLRGGLRNEDFE